MAKTTNERARPETKLTPEQMQDAERLAKILSTLPKEKQLTVTMMVNAFIAGMEAQANMVRSALL